jgi:NitT/TauT family transport system permease protein
MMASITPRKAPGEQARAPAGSGRSYRRSQFLFGTLGVVAILVGWQLLSMMVSPAIMASPGDTAVALARLAWGSELWLQLLITLKRLVIGLAIGAATGFILGVLSGLEPRLRAFLEPIRWVGMTIPAVIIAVLALLWFGLGDVTVIFVVAAIVVPLVFVNTVAGVLAIDRRLVEVGHVYRFPWHLQLSQVYLPGIASPVMAGLTLAAGVAVRAVVLAELLGAMNGIGYAFSRAMSYLETPLLFAWIVVLLILMAVLEFGVLRPLKRRTMRWRRGAGQ